jgi:hypothetical protein
MLSQVTHHSAIFPPSMRDTAPKIKLRPPPRRWKWPHWPLLRPLIRGPCSDEIPLGDGALFIRFAAAKPSPCSCASALGRQRPTTRATSYTRVPCSGDLIP